MVIKRSKTKKGTEIVLHDFENGFYSIMAYPIAVQTDYERLGIERGRIFCLDMTFDTLESTILAFEELENGKKELLDFKDNFWNPSDAQFI